MDAPAVGDVVAEKYRVERVLGQGGMGVVLAATHLHLGNRVAIKCLLPEAARQPEALARFVQEARACASMQSEHIVRVYDVGAQPSGAPFLVMELLDGKDLSEHLKERGALPVDEAVGYVIDACEGLCEAHAAGVIHRDLKPSNLFVVPRKSGGRGVVKLLDFGISKLMNPPPSSEESLGKTATGSLLGSPFYMAPEQITDASAVDARSDIWSLGVVLFELCAGARPFTGENAATLLGKILTDEAPPLRSRRPDAPPWLEAVVARCLRKPPAQRYQSAVELARALAAGAAQGALEATALDPSSADHQAIAARRQRYQQDVSTLTSAHGPGVCLSIPYRPEVCLSVARPEATGRRWLLGAGAAAIVAGAAAGGGWVQMDRRRPVQIRGSSTLGLQVLPAWRAALEREGIRVEATSPGTTRGIEALIASRDETLAAASRQATPEEQTRAEGRLNEHLIGYDAIAIVVNVDNPVPRLSLGQLRALFSGKARDWAELGGEAGPIHLLMRPEELGGHEALRGLLGGDLRFVEGAEVVRANGELAERIKADRHAVSFASFTVTGPVRQVPLGKDEQGPFVAPSTTTVRQGVYPLVRPLLFYSWGKARGPAQRFLAFTRGSAAQDALLGAGFVPLR